MQIHVLAALRPHPTFAAVQAGIPTEPQALFVYALLLISLIFIWRGSRGGGDGPAPGDPTGSQGGEHGSPPLDRTRRKRRSKRPINWIQ